MFWSFIIPLRSDDNDCIGWTFDLDLSNQTWTGDKSCSPRTPAKIKITNESFRVQFTALKET